MEDFQAWEKYSHLHNWFNKLHVAMMLGYNCGPGGVPPKTSGYYCVRPIYNLGGMGVGARKQWIEAGDIKSVEPGYFWCEWFAGRQFSVTYEWIGEWNPISCWEGHRDVNHLYRFKKWVRSDHYPLIGSIYDDLADSNITQINIEFIEDNPIEVHLRTSPDPDYDEFIPIWEDERYLVDIYTKMGYSWIEAIDDSNGFLPVNRIGFMVK